MRYILALDQGTTSSRAIVFDATGTSWRRRSRSSADLSAARLGRARPERDLGDAARRRAARRSRKAGVSARDVAAIGITNQRETTVVWDRATGRADRATRSSGRTGARRRSATQLRAARPWAARSARRPGSCSTPTSPAPRSPGCSTTCRARAQRAERGELAFGTIDSWLHLEAHRRRGARHRRDQRIAHDAVRHPHAATGTTSCSTLLDVPRAVLPQVALVERGRTARPTRDLLGAPIPIAGIAGDQQAALFGQACFSPGMAKNTYGTGCFLLHEHRQRAPSRRSNRLLTTVALAASASAPITRSRAACSSRGAAVQWLRDGLGSSRTSADIEALAASVARQRRRLLRAGVHRARRAALGSVRARRDHRAHARHDRGAHRARRARVDRVPERGRAGRDAEATPASAAASCASTAARPPTTC